MGIYSCIGENKEQVVDSLYMGRSGIGLDPARKEMGYRSALTGILRKPDLKLALNRRQRTMLSEHGAYAYMATVEAMTQAGIDADWLKNHEVGILYGNDSSAEAVVHGADVIREKHNTMLVGSGNIFQSMNSTLTMNLSTIFNLRGINFTLSGACASGSHAIGMAYLLIRQGLQECVLCGGAEEVNVFSMGNFDALGAFSIREDEPERASRPFDKNRDGLVPSGGNFGRGKLRICHESRCHYFGRSGRIRLFVERRTHLGSQCGWPGSFITHGFAGCGNDSSPDRIC